MILWESGFQFPFDRELILGTSFRKALQNRSVISSSSLFCLVSGGKKKRF